MGYKVRNSGNPNNQYCSENFEDLLLWIRKEGEKFIDYNEFS